MRNTLVPAIIKIFSVLPLGVSRALGACIGTCLWLIKGRDYRITLGNIRLCFPELALAEAQQLSRLSLIETAKTAIEVGAIWRNSWEWLQTKIVSVEGEALLHEEIAKGQGLLVLSPHLGNWEVIAHYIASKAPLTAMYQPFAIPAVDELILKGRSKTNIHMAPTNRKGLCMLLKALQDGKAVGILPDQLPKKDAGSDFAPFFGQNTLTMSLAHSLITRTHCRVISAFAMRVEGGFKIVVVPVAPEIYSDDLAESLRGLNLSVEACVRFAPAQYQWEYNRFRFPKSHREFRQQKGLAHAEPADCIKFVTKDR